MRTRFYGSDPGNRDALRRSAEDDACLIAACARAVSTLILCALLAGCGGIGGLRQQAIEMTCRQDDVRFICQQRQLMWDLKSPGQQLQERHNDAMIGLGLSVLLIIYELREEK